MDIPQIPGLPLHPTQVAERQKKEELRRQQPELARQQAIAANQQKRSSLMSDQTRTTLKRVAQSMPSVSVRWISGMRFLTSEVAATHRQCSTPRLRA